VTPFDDELLTVDTGEAARRLGLLTHDGRPNRRAVQRHIRLGLLNALQYGRGYRVPLGALKEFQERCRVKQFDPSISLCEPPNKTPEIRRMTP
jgi:hypothetical protein